MEAEVVENPNQRRFELPLGDDAVAAAYYRVEGGSLVLIHTEVPSEYAGQGAATRLALGTFALIRASGRKAILRCPFMVKFFTSHQEYADVVVG